MLSPVRKIILTGVHDNESYHQNSRTILLNYMCIIGILVSMIFLTINLTKQNNSLFIWNNLGGQVIFISTVLLNYLRYYRVAVWFCCIAFLIFINFIALVNGPESGAVYMNLVICISSLLFFEKKSEIVTLSILSVIAFFFCSYMYKFHPLQSENKNLEVYFYVYSSALFLASYMVVRRYKKEIGKYTGQILNQKNELETKNKEISDSLFYAQTIQKTILRFDPAIEKSLSEAFILFKPKDVVSGDFFWFAEVDHFIVGCVADCTGHGVPGALMSMIGTTLLRETVIEKKITNPDEILENIRKGIIDLLKQTEEHKGSKDGMDISLCVYNKQNHLLNFSGANNNGYIIRGFELIELFASKLPIGIYPGEQQKFNSQCFQLQKNDCLYLFTDGFSDQFGGPNGKKYKKKNLLSFLLKNSSQPMSHQKKLLETELINWRKQLEQTDDVTIVGVRF